MESRITSNRRFSYRESPFFLYHHPYNFPKTLEVTRKNRLIQVLHSATSTTSFCNIKCFIQPTKLPLPPSEVESITQRSRIFHPAKSNPSPSEVVSFNSMKRMNLRNDVHDAKEAHLMITRMLLKLRPDVSVTTSGRIFCCVGT